MPCSHRVTQENDFQVQPSWHCQLMQSLPKETQPHLKHSPYTYCFADLQNAKSQESYEVKRTCTKSSAGACEGEHCKVRFSPERSHVAVQEALKMKAKLQWRPQDIECQHHGASLEESCWHQVEMTQERGYIDHRWQGSRNEAVQPHITPSHAPDAKHKAVSFSYGLAGFHPALTPFSSGAPIPQFLEWDCLSWRCIL